MHKFPIKKLMHPEINRHLLLKYKIRYGKNTIFYINKVKKIYYLNYIDEKNHLSYLNYGSINSYKKYIYKYLKPILGKENIIASKIPMSSENSSFNTFSFNIKDENFSSNMDNKNISLFIQDIFYFLLSTFKISIAKAFT